MAGECPGGFRLAIRLQSMTPCRANFNHVYLNHHRYVRGIACRILRNRLDAEDVVQETFLQAWRRIDQFDAARGEIRAWLGAIARTRALDRIRRDAVRFRCEYKADLSPPAQDAWRSVSLWEGADLMRRAWPQLPIATRRILALAYYEDWSQRRIAGDLQLTLGIVKSRLQQGLRMLREQMDSKASSTAKSDLVSRAPRQRDRRARNKI